MGEHRGFWVLTPPISRVSSTMGKAQYLTGVVMMVRRIDAHVHGKAPNCSAEAAQYVEKYRALGIDKIVLIESPGTVLRAMETCGDFIIPVFRVDPDTVTEQEIRDYFHMGCRGIKFIAPLHAYSDSRYLPLYKTIAAHDGVAVFHTGYLTHRDYRIYTHVNLFDMAPAHLDHIARQIPHLKMLMSHYGNPWWNEAWKVSYSHENIYADLSGGTAYICSLWMWKELFAPNGKLHTESVRKLCFASDIVYFRESLNVEPYFEFHDTLLEQIGASQELIQRINYDNIADLFSL